MFISKKFVPRRTFLRGAGITLGLPLLDSMVPAQTPLDKTAAAPVKRFLGIWHPHGAAPGYWSPLQEGANFDFSFITKPLEPFRNRVTLISGMDMPEAMATTDEPGGDHARGAVLLSAARPRRNAVSPYLGVTIDQLIAKKYGRDTILESVWGFGSEVNENTLEVFMRQLRLKVDTGEPKLIHTVRGYGYRMQEP